MTALELKIADILGAPVKVTRIGNDLKIRIDDWIESQFKILLKLANLLGTEEIDFTDEQDRGCETCGHGAFRTLEAYNCTNLPEDL